MKHPFHLRMVFSTMWPLTHLFTDSLLLQPMQLKPLSLLCILTSVNFLYGVLRIVNITRRERITSTGILRNVGLLSHDKYSSYRLSEQPWSVWNSSGLEVSIITSRQIPCIFGNMCLFSSKTTKIPLNLRLMKNFWASLVKLQRLLEHILRVSSTTTASATLLLIFCRLNPWL